MKCQKIFILALIGFVNLGINLNGITVSTVSQLETAIDNANSGGDKEIILQDGTYVLNYSLSIWADGITIRSQSGNRNSVTVRGQGMYGSVEFIFYGPGSNLTVRDTTIGWVANHAIQIWGHENASNILISNCRIVDTYEQMVKITYESGNSNSSENGIMENCLLEYSAGIGPNYYIGGIDGHQCKNWIVRDNTFKNISSPSGDIAEHAVHFWSGSSDTLVENNLIIDCDRGIGFGLGSSTHVRGIIRNNMIYHSSTDPGFADVGIGLESASNAKVYNNTIYMANSYSNAIEYRFSGTSGGIIKNILTNKAITSRDGGSADTGNNITNAQAFWFVNVSSGDLHLASPVTQVVDQGVAITGLNSDCDGEARPQGAGIDIGADEYTTTTSPSLTLTAPDGGENWQVGSSQNITWVSSGSVGNIKIEYSSDSGSSWSKVVTSTSNSGSYTWTIPNTPSSQCLVRISEAADGNPSDTSNAVFNIVNGAGASLTVTSPNGGENWEVGSSHNITWSSFGSVGNIKIQYSIDNGNSWDTVINSSANDGSYAWTVPNETSSQALVRISEASDGSPADISNAVFFISSSSSGNPIIGLSRTQLNYGADKSGNVTGIQNLLVENYGTGSLQWNISDNTSWLSVSPVSGTGAGVISVSVNTSGLAVGSYTGKLSVSDANATNSPQEVTIKLYVYQGGASSSPFGEFATPVNNSTVSSSIPVTGWVLDDIEVMNVKIYNGTSYIGDAVFVEGARPDVEDVYPDYPRNYRAGWGYMLLTNFLPNGGNGTYTLYAKATDAEGNQISLGSKTIICDNANAVKPFGAIDTPGQGGVATGSKYVNWGWVLTPQPNEIPTNGLFINVYIDGVRLGGHPTYNLYRSDIANLFPGYANSNGAAGYFIFDTFGYGNGVHTIQWTAQDNAGNSAGIGSRYFSIQNSSQRSTPQMKKTGSIQTGDFSRNSSESLLNGLSQITTPIFLKKEFTVDSSPDEIYPNAEGTITIRSHELERLEIFLNPGEVYSKSYKGYLLVRNELRSLPIGSYLDGERGIFYWSPGPGFYGNYRFIFVDEFSKGVRKIEIDLLAK